MCCGCVHRYDFATVHSTAKGLFTSIDCFMYGAEVSSLLLWWGDVTAMRAGVAKVLDAHAKVLGSVQRGETSAETCAYEAFCACACLAPDCGEGTKDTQVWSGTIYKNGGIR